MSDVKMLVEGVKKDSGKERWELLPLHLLSGMVRVLGFGANKYSDDNWLQVPDGKRRYYSAMMRHISAWQSGDTIDSETGENHLDHALCCLVFLRHFDRMQDDNNCENKKCPTCRGSHG